MYSNTFVRYDSTKSFIDTVNSWQRISMTVAQGGTVFAAPSWGCAFDGKYIYYAACSSATFIRFLANNTNTPGPIEYAQVSS
jgi:hypothetical protein